MKKSILILVGVFTMGFVNAQERTYEVLNGKTTFTPYLGFVHHTNIELKSLAYPSSYSTRIGFKTASTLTKNLSLKFDAMQDFNNRDSWGFSSISLKYSLNNFWIEAGKTGSAATLFRPYPVSLEEQLGLFLAELYVPGGPLFTGKAGFQSLNFAATFSVAERGNYLIGDSTEYALKLDIYNNSFGAYLLDGQPGAMYKYFEDGVFYQLIYWRKDVITSATCLDIPKDFQIAIDFAWNYSNSFNNEDYMGLFLIKKLKIEYENQLIHGRIIVGYDNLDVLSFRLGVFF